MRERVHGPLVLDKAVHARHTADDIELGLVGRVAVPRLLPRHVRSAAGHANGSGSRVGRVDGVALVALEPVHLEPPLVAKEVVKGTVLLVEHDDVLDARVSRREEQEGVHRRTTRRARRGPRVLLLGRRNRRATSHSSVCLTAVGVAVGCPALSDAAFHSLVIERRKYSSAVRWSYDEFETGGELRDGKGAQIKMGKDSEPLRSGKGRALTE